MPREGEAGRRAAWGGLCLLALGQGCATPETGRAEPSGPWVHAIDFRGNQHVKDASLREVIALERTSWVPLSPKKYFDPLTLEVDRRRVEAYYHAHGYFSARVTGTRVEPRGQGDSVDVHLDVDEGPRTTVTAVRLLGLDGLTPRERDEVTAHLPLAPGRPFDHAEYLDEKALLEARLRATSRAWAEVRGQALVDRDHRTAVIELEATPGPQVRYGQVQVVGTPLAEEVRRRVRITPGAPFRPDDLDDSRGRLRAVGLFSIVRVDPVRRPGDPTVADVQVHVEPGARNDFKLGVGVGFESDRQELRLPVAYARSGFLGGFRSLTLRARPGFVALPTFWDRRSTGPALRLDATFLQPDLAVRDLALRARAGFDLGVDYAFKYYGPRAGLGLDYSLWRSRVSFSASYNFQYLVFYQLTDPNVFADPDQARLFLGYTNPYRLGYLLGGVTLDLRDAALEPHRGLYAGLTFEGGTAALGGRFTYEKAVGDLRVYYTIAERLTLSARFLYGRLFAQGDTASPITRRFYAGGSDSHRGFSYQRLSPQVQSATLGVGIPVGGDEELVGQFEARGNLFKIAGSWVGLAGFVDVGDVPDPRFGLDLRQLHVAVGPGLRYQTPLGVLRFDLGVRVNRLDPFQPDGRQNPDPGSRFAWHINLGEAF